MVLPILFMLVFGMMEGALWFRDNLTMSYVSRDLVRVLGTRGSTLTADQLAVEAAFKAASALRNGAYTIDLITVFRATCASTSTCTSASAPIESVNDLNTPACTAPPSGMSAGVAGLCNVYRPRGGITQAIVDDDRYWGCVATDVNIQPLDSSWCPSTRKIALSDYGGTGPDYVGVRVVMTHTSITKLPRLTGTIVSETVYRVEPQR